MYFFAASIEVFLANPISIFFFQNKNNKIVQVQGASVVVYSIQ